MSEPLTLRGALYNFLDALPEDDQPSDISLFISNLEAEILAEAAADGDLTTAYMVGYEKGKAAASPSTDTSTDPPPGEFLRPEFLDAVRPAVDRLTGRTDTSTALREAAEAVDAAWLAFDVPGWSVERAFPLRAAMNALRATLSVTPQDTTE